MLGFFSSSAICTLSDGFALFLYNGGTMRLIINNILSAQDKDAIIAGIKDNSTILFDLTDIEQLRDTFLIGGKISRKQTNKLKFLK